MLLRGVLVRLARARGVPSQLTPRWYGCTAACGAPLSGEAAAAPAPPAEHPSRLYIRDSVHALAARLAKPAKDDVVTPVECVVLLSAARSVNVNAVAVVRLCAGGAVPLTPELAGECFDTCARQGAFDLTLEVLEECERQGLSPPSPGVLHRAVKEGVARGAHAAASHAYQALVDRGWDIPADVMVSAAMARLRLSDVDGSISLLRSAASADPAALSPVFVDAYVDVLLVAGLSERAFEVFELAVGAGTRLMHGTVLRVVMAAGNSGPQLRALLEYCVRNTSLHSVLPQVSRAMRGSVDTTELAPLIELVGAVGDAAGDELLANLLVTAFAKAGNFAGAAAVWDIMRLQRIRPNSLACVTWMRALVTANKPGEALVVFDRMLANRMQPDHFSFSAVLKCCQKLQDYEKAKKYFRILQQDQGFRKGVVPNEPCYNAMIQCCIIASARSDAIDLLERMRKSGVTPSSNTYKLLMMACAATRAFHTAFTLFDEAKLDGLRGDENLFSALLVNASRARSVELMKEAVLLMDQDEFVKTETVYQMLTHCAAVCGDSDAAVRWLRELRSKFGASLHQFAEVMGAKAELGDVSLVSELAAMAAADGVADDGTLTAQRIAATAFAGKIEEAIAMLSETFPDKFAPQLAAYVSVIRASGRAEHVRLCVDAVTAALAVPGFHPKPVLFVELLKLCARACDASAALSALSLVSTTDVPLTVQMYNSVLDACVAADRPDIAQQTVDHMITTGVRPNAETFQTLSKARLPEFQREDGLTDFQDDTVEDENESESGDSDTDGLEEEGAVKEVGHGFNKRDVLLQNVDSAIVRERRRLSALPRASVHSASAYTASAYSAPAYSASPRTDTPSVASAPGEADGGAGTAAAPPRAARVNILSAGAVPVAAQVPPDLTEFARSLEALKLAELQQLAASQGVARYGTKAHIKQRLVAAKFPGAHTPQSP